LPLPQAWSGTHSALGNDYFCTLAQIIFMYQLTYCSKASNDVNEEVIENILETARKRNETLGVTGCLVFHKHAFVQIIEGEKEQIQLLYHQIKQDARHREVVLLWEGINDSRNFNDWNMAFYSAVDGLGKNGELRNFERNLLLLAELTDSATSSLNMFWISVRKLLTEE